MKDDQTNPNDRGMAPEVGPDVHEVTRAILGKGLTDEVPHITSPEFSKAVQACYTVFYSLIGV